MTDDDDKKYAIHRMRVGDTSRNQSSNPLIARDKLATLLQRPDAQSDQSVAPDARHRAWLRQVVKREK